MGMKKTRFTIFDFDNTLAMTPTRPLDWEGHDWWGSEDSLTAPLYDGRVIKNVIDIFHQCKSDPSTYAIMMTGRRSCCAHCVRDILRANGLFGKRMISPLCDKERQRFRNIIASGRDQIHPRENDKDAHEEYYVGDWNEEPDYPTVNGKKGLVKDGSTWALKSYIIKRIARINKGFETIELFDDRKDHMDSFKKLGHQILRDGLASNFIIHQVFPPAGDYDATIIDIPVR